MYVGYTYPLKSAWFARVSRWKEVRNWSLQSQTYLCHDVNRYSYNIRTYRISSIRCRRTPSTRSSIACHVSGCSRQWIRRRCPSWCSQTSRRDSWPAIDEITTKEFSLLIYNLYGNREDRFSCVRWAYLKSASRLFNNLWIFNIGLIFSNTILILLSMQISKSVFIQMYMKNDVIFFFYISWYL